MAIAKLYPGTAPTNGSYNINPWDFGGSAKNVVRQFEITKHGDNAKTLHVEFQANACVYVVTHFPASIKYTLQCWQHLYQTIWTIDRKDVVDIANQYTFEQSLAEVFSEKCYTEKASHCEHMYPFLSDVKERGWDQDFEIQAMISLGPRLPLPPGCPLPPKYMDKRTGKWLDLFPDYYEIAARPELHTLVHLWNAASISNKEAVLFATALKPKRSSNHKSKGSSPAKPVLPEEKQLDPSQVLETIQEFCS